MSWTYEWANRLGNLGSLEALLQITSLAGGLPHIGAQSYPTSDRSQAVIPVEQPVVNVPQSDAQAVVTFWRAAGSALWFAKDDEFDRRFRDGFLGLHEAAARGELFGWLATPTGALALLILLDQFPRNAFRGSPRMYATDTMAREVANAAIEAGHDRASDKDLRLFFYLPFGHSEDLADQTRSVALCEHLGEPNITHAKRHCDIVQRFGRFPHRNPILNRTMRQEEQQFLNDGGYSG